MIFMLFDAIIGQHLFIRSKNHKNLFYLEAIVIYDSFIYKYNPILNL